jgi:hypothetical protein
VVALTAVMAGVLGGYIRQGRTQRLTASEAARGLARKIRSRGCEDAAATNAIGRAAGIRKAKAAGTATGRNGGCLRVAIDGREQAVALAALFWSRSVKRLGSRLARLLLLYAATLHRQFSRIEGNSVGAPNAGGVFGHLTYGRANLRP